MDLTGLFVEALSPITCLALLRGWLRSYHEGCARQIMADDAVSLLLPSKLQYSGLRKGRLFKLSGSEFLSEHVENKTALAKLNGMSVPAGFILYFQDVVRRFSAVPFPVLDVMENTTTLIGDEVGRVYAGYRARLAPLALHDLLSAVERPSIVYLTVDTPVWQAFWEKATLLRVRRRIGDISLQPLVGCTRCLDVHLDKLRLVSTTGFSMETPDAYFGQCGVAISQSSDQWIISHRDAFLLLFVLSETYNVSQLLCLPYGGLNL